MINAGYLRHTAAPVTDATARCEPIPAFPLRPEMPTGPVWPSAASTPARCEPLSPDRLTPASRAGLWSGTMAADAREQAASCDAFVLSRRPPAPDAPPILVRGRKQVAADLAKIFEDRCLFEEGVCRWHITGEIPVRTRPLSTHAGFPKSAR